MSASAIALSAYLAALGESIQDENQQRQALNETKVVINYHDQDIPFSHQGWQILDKTVCNQHNRNSPHYSACTIKAKSLFNQICSALTNRTSAYWHHQKYKEMYCHAAVNFSPMVATISYGKSTQMTPQERKCNQLILKALVDRNQTTIEERNQACKNIEQ